MKPLKLLLAICCTLATSFAEEKPAADGFVALFDGKTLNGWNNPYEWGKAEVVDGEIHLTGDKKFFLITEKTYGDFVFEGDVLLPPGKANSGFIFRGQVEPNKVFGYQCEVDGDATRAWSGGLYDEGRRMWFISPIKGDAASEAAFNNAPAAPSSATTGTPTASPARARNIKIEVNGVITTDVVDEKDASGVSPSSTTAKKAKPTSSAISASRS